MYRVACKSADLLRMSLVTIAAMLAICVLALVAPPNTAEAEDSLSVNGKIAFAFDPHQDQGVGIYSVDPDGSSLRRLTRRAGYLGIPAWSPDGTKMAFGYDGSIWVMGRSTCRLGPLRLSSSVVLCYHPSLGPILLP